MAEDTPLITVKGCPGHSSPCVLRAPGGSLSLKEVLDAVGAAGVLASGDGHGPWWVTPTDRVPAGEYTLRPAAAPVAMPAQQGPSPDCAGAGPAKRDAAMAGHDAHGGAPCAKRPAASAPSEPAAPGPIPLPLLAAASTGQASGPSTQPSHRSSAGAGAGAGATAPLFLQPPAAAADAAGTDAPGTCPAVDQAPSALGPPGVILGAASAASAASVPAAAAAAVDAEPDRDPRPRSLTAWTLMHKQRTSKEACTAFLCCVEDLNPIVWPCEWRVLDLLRTVALPAGFEDQSWNYRYSRPPPGWRTRQVQEVQEVPGLHYRSSYQLYIKAGRGAWVTELPDPDYSTPEGSLDYPQRWNPLALYVGSQPALFDPSDWQRKSDKQQVKLGDVLTAFGFADWAAGVPHACLASKLKKSPVAPSITAMAKKAKARAKKLSIDLPSGMDDAALVRALTVHESGSGPGTLPIYWSFCKDTLLQRGSFRHCQSTHFHSVVEAARGRIRGTAMSAGTAAAAPVSHPQPAASPSNDPAAATNAALWAPQPLQSHLDGQEDESDQAYWSDGPSSVASSTAGQCTESDTAGNPYTNRGRTPAVLAILAQYGYLFCPAIV
eukprot:gene9579-1722_t